MERIRAGLENQDLDRAARASRQDKMGKGGLYEHRTRAEKGDSFSSIKGMW